MTEARRELSLEYLIEAVREGTESAEDIAFAVARLSKEDQARFKFAREVEEELRTGAAVVWEVEPGQAPEPAPAAASPIRRRESKAAQAVEPDPLPADDLDRAEVVPKPVPGKPGKPGKRSAAEIWRDREPDPEEPDEERAGGRTVTRLVPKDARHRTIAVPAQALTVWAGAREGGPRAGLEVILARGRDEALRLNDGAGDDRATKDRVLRANSLVDLLDLRQGMILRNIRNAKIISAALGARCQRNTFSGEDEIRWGEFEGAAEVSVKIREMAGGWLGGFEPSADNVAAALMSMCLDNKYHPVRDKLDGLCWEGAERAELLFVRGFGVEDTPLYREYGKIFLTAGAARIYEPGYKTDYVMTPWGPEDFGKSLGFENLSYGWYANEDIVCAKAKDIIAKTSGVLIYELAELDKQLLKHGQLFKNFITKTQDRDRALYTDRGLNKQNRCFSWAGTANRGDFLNEDSGLRRIKLMHCVRAVDQDWILQYRDQLWAEGVVLYRQGYKTWLENEDLKAQALAEAIAASNADAKLSILRRRFDWIITSGEAVPGKFEVVINRFGARELRVSSRWLGEELYGIAKDEPLNFFQITQIATIAVMLGLEPFGSSGQRIGGRVEKGYRKVLLG